MRKEQLLEKALCCNRCGTCRGVSQDAVPDIAFATQCPCGMTLYGAYEPSGLMYLARGIAQGDLEWNEDLAKVLYSCTMCGYCEDLCQRGYRHVPAIEILEELRRIVPEKLKPKHIRQAASSLNIAKTQKLGLLAQYGVADVVGENKAGAVLFGDPVLLASSAKVKEIGFIIEKSGKKLGCFMSEPLPPVSAALINGGCEQELAEAMSTIDERLAAHGVQKVYVYHPESLSVLKRLSTSGVEFVSIVQLYNEVLKKKKAKKIKLSATYQDPCHLGRYAGEYTAPREVLKRLGVEVKEMWRRGRDSLCCGAGGGVLADNPALAKQYAANRWHEAKATGAGVLITACPSCTANLSGTKPKGFKVVELSTLVAQAYGYGGKEAGK